jgi:AcrR family transcriptional regulator
MAKRKSSEEKRKHIRYAAYICFRENGYYQTSIDDICTAADISKGSFYWHYGAKLDVFIDILETWAREVIDELLEQFEEATQSPDRIRLLSQALEKEFHRARAIVPLWTEFSLLGRKDSEIQISIGKFFRRARAAIAEILRQTARDSLSEEEVKAISSVILGAYMGVILQEFADPNTNAADWARDFVGTLRLLFKEPNTNGLKSSLPIGERMSRSRLNTIVSNESNETNKLFYLIRDYLTNNYPEVDEKWIKGWKVIGYYNNGLVCHIKIKDDVIELAFYQGSTLSDPTSLLSGAGKYRRTVVISSNHVIYSLSSIIREAFQR